VVCVCYINFIYIQIEFGWMDEGPLCDGFLRAPKILIPKV